jgi:hypothetical protein
MHRFLTTMTQACLKLGPVIDQAVLRFCIQVDETCPSSQQNFAMDTKLFTCRQMVGIGTLGGLTTSCVLPPLHEPASVVALGSEQLLWVISKRRYTYWNAKTEVRL